MSRDSRAADHSALYNSSNSQLSSRVRTSHSPSRSSSVSSTSSSLTFTKEEDIAAPTPRTSALAAQLRVSLSRREKSVSRSTSSHDHPPSHSQQHRDADDDFHDEQREQHDSAATTGSVDGRLVSVALGRLPFECRVFIHKSVLGFIATSRQRQHARSISSSSSSPSSDSPSLSPSCSSLSSGDSSSLPCVIFHVNEHCSLQRMACELIQSCLPRSSTTHPHVDILSLSKSFRLVAATPAGRIDEDCPALSPLQSVHHFNLEHFLFVLAHPDQPVPWSLWSLPPDELHVGPRVLLSSLPSLLLQAAGDGDVDRARVLLDEGVGADSADGEGLTGLHLAARGGQVAVVHLLCKRGVDVDRRDRRGRTALLLAVQHEQVECVEALLLWGASVQLEDERGRSAVQLAKEHGLQEIVDMLDDFAKDTEEEGVDDEERRGGEDWEDRQRSSHR